MTTERTVADCKNQFEVFEKTQITEHEVTTGHPVTLAQAQALINYIAATCGVDALYTMHLNTAVRISDHDQQLLELIKQRESGVVEL